MDWSPTSCWLSDDRANVQKICIFLKDNHSCLIWKKRVVYCRCSFKSINPLISGSTISDPLNLTLLLRAKLIVDVELAGDVPGRIQNLLWGYSRVEEPRTNCSYMDTRGQLWSLFYILHSTSSFAINLAHWPVHLMGQALAGCTS